MRIVLLAIRLMMAGQGALAQDHLACDIKYQSQNQIDYGPLALTAAGGIVLGPDSSVIPDACVGLFTESDHTLLVSVKSDNAGKFIFDKLPHGRYRLVVALLGFAPANAKVSVEASIRKRFLYAHMIVGAIDTSSYVNLKP